MCALNRLKEHWWSSVLTLPQPPQSCSSGESCADFLQIRAGCSSAWGCAAPLEQLAHWLPVNTAMVLWFFKCPLSSNGNNLWCLTSTPCYLSPAVAEEDVSCQLCHADASSCPDLLPCWHMGFNREPALYSSAFGKVNTLVSWTAGLSLQRHFLPHPAYVVRSHPVEAVLVAEVKAGLSQVILAKPLISRLFFFLVMEIWMFHNGDLNSFYKKLCLFTILLLM